MAGPPSLPTESCQLLAADSEDPSGVSGDERPRRLRCRSVRWKLLLPLPALAAAAAALLALRTGNPPATDRELVQLQQLQPGGFFLCSGTGSCGVQSFQSWNQPPALLAGRVNPFLQEVPGIPSNVFAQVAQHWQSFPPSFKGTPVGLEAIAGFVKRLLASDPFGTGAQVPYVQFHDKGEGQAVAITQKQLAFIVANVIMGNDIASGNGLSATIRRCSARGAKAFVFSLLSLLAVLSQELASGAQGSTLIAAVPRAKDDSWKSRLEHKLVVSTALHKEMGFVQGDFMAGGMPGQAMTDIAGTVVGGGAALCDLANSQDESLVQFYSEVLAFVFFAAPGKMLPVPWVLVGARRYMGELTGESASSGPLMNRCGHIAQADWLNQGIPVATTQVLLNGEPKAVASSTFVAVASVCSGSGGGVCPNAMAVNNNCDSQRRHADRDISNWYQAFEPSMYPAPVQQAISAAVRRIGTGPWGAGVWWGDSQQYFLTVLLATSLLAQSPPLDYYLYDHFCENPGNQCFVLGSSGCSECIMQSKAHNIHWNRCGNAGIFEMLQRFSGKPAKHLYLALHNVGGPPAQVFDTLMSWHPSPVELATPIAASGPAPPPQEPAVPPPTGPAGPTAPLGTPQGGVAQPSMPLPPPATSPGLPAEVPAEEPFPGAPEPEPSEGFAPPTQQMPLPAYAPPPPARTGRCLHFLHRHLCLPQFHLPHLR